MIRIVITKNDIWQSGKNCGVCGEANSTELIIAFSEDWLAYSKKVVFYDARGENPVGVLLLETNRVRNEEKETYSITIPAEPLKYKGKIEFVIEGRIEGVIKKSVAGELMVGYAPDSNTEDMPGEVAQTLAEQLQAEALRVGEIAQSVRNDANNGVFDGKDGYTPQKGVDYFDGYTPVKGVDYFDGEKGEKGEQGIQGVQGVQGEKGADGYTPQKGVDYWTDSDKEEIKSYVNEAILGGAW